MSKQQAIEAMQAHLGTTHVVIDVDLDAAGDWFGCVCPFDNDGQIIGMITIDFDGYSVPFVSWD